MIASSSSALVKSIFNSSSTFGSKVKGIGLCIWSQLKSWAKICPCLEVSNISEPFISSQKYEFGKEQEHDLIFLKALKRILESFAFLHVPSQNCVFASKMVFPRVACLLVLNSEICRKHLNSQFLKIFFKSLALKGLPCRSSLTQRFVPTATVRRGMTHYCKESIAFKMTQSSESLIHFPANIGPTNELCQPCNPF